MLSIYCEWIIRCNTLGNFCCCRCLFSLFFFFFLNNEFPRLLRSPFNSRWWPRRYRTRCFSQFESGTWIHVSWNTCLGNDFIYVLYKKYKCVRNVHTCSRRYRRISTLHIRDFEKDTLMIWWFFLGWGGR